MFWNCVFFQFQDFLKTMVPRLILLFCVAVISVRLLRSACQCLQKRHLDFLRIALNLQINFESISILTILNLPIICWRCLYIYVDHSFNNVVSVFSVYLTLLFIQLCLNTVLFLWCHKMEILPDKYTLLS